LLDRAPLCAPADLIHSDGTWNRCFQEQYLTSNRRTDPPARTAGYSAEKWRIGHRGPRLVSSGHCLNVRGANSHRRTTARVMGYFYMLINCGALSGQIGMVFAEVCYVPLR
jgi:hypothetical protein